MIKEVAHSFLSLFVCSSFILKAETFSVPTPYLKDNPSTSSNETMTIQSNNNLKLRVKAQAEVKPPSFFGRRAEGWHWYEDSLKQEKREEERKDSGETPLSSSKSPTEIIEAQRKALEKKLHTAIIEPTRENIISYILAQKVLMDQSEKFAEGWKRVVMTTPSLDETLIHPVDQNARHVYYGERNKDLAKRIRALAQEYGLFFFFKKGCPYCHHFAPVVKHFAEKHGWSVLAVSLDGGTLPEYPHAKRDNGIASRLQVGHVPALIALHSGSGQTLPLAYGLVSESEIEERVDLLTRVAGFEGGRK